MEIRRQARLVAGAEVDVRCRDGIIGYARRVALDGFSLDKSPGPGRSMLATLWWRSTAKTTENFLVEIEALDPSGATVARKSGHLLEDWFPTSIWEPGRRFLIPVRLDIPAAAPEGLQIRLTVRGESNGRNYAPEGPPGDERPIIWPRPGLPRRRAGAPRARSAPLAR